MDFDKKTKSQTQFYLQSYCHPIIDFVCFFLYRWFLLPFFLKTLFILKKYTSPKLQEMIKERKEASQLDIPLSLTFKTKPFWIHASSGEIEYAKPLIRLLKEKWPEIPLMVTYFSPSAKRLVKGMPEIDLLLPLPWDHRKFVNKFLTRYQPRLLLIARTDVWPEFTFQCMKMKIPSLLFSATFAENSNRLKNFFSRSLTRSGFSFLSTIGVVSEDDKANILNLGLIKTPIHIFGDTRFDQVFFRLSQASQLKPLLKKAPRDDEASNHQNHKDQQNQDSFSGRRFVFGSTWPEDELALSDFISFWIKDCRGQCIIAPHELSESRLESLEAFFLKSGWKWLRYSLATEWQQEEILLVDKIGILSEIYQWGDFAFVGGSFKDKVHSVMEPLATGLPVFVGPYHKNNRETSLFQTLPIRPPLYAVNVVKDSQELIVLLKKSLDQFQMEAQKKEGLLHLWTNRELILLEMKKRRGSSEKILQWVSEI